MNIRLKLKNRQYVRCGIYDLIEQQYIAPNFIDSWSPESGNYFYVADGMELTLPPIPVELHISAGMRWLPMIISVSPTQDNKTVAVALEPFEPYNSSAVDADLHIHGPFRDNEEIEPITLQNLPIEFLAEDMTFPCCVDVFSEPLEISPTQQLHQTPEYRSGTFGHYVFLRCNEFLAYDREHYPSEQTPVLPTELFAKVKKAEGFILCSHAVTCENIHDETSWPGGGYARALPALQHLGLVNAFSLGDISALLEPTKQMWYHLLNADRFLPIAAGSDICMRQADNPFPPIGSVRTVVPVEDVGNNPSFDVFLKAIKLGRSSVSTAPMIDFSIDGIRIGGRLSENPTRNLKINIQSPKPLDCVRIIIDGQVWKEFQNIGIEWNHSELLPAGIGGWVAIECCGPADWWYPLGLWGHTNPIFTGESVTIEYQDAAKKYFLKMADELEICLGKRGMPVKKISKVCELTRGK